MQLFDAILLYLTELILAVLKTTTKPLTLIQCHYTVFHRATSCTDVLIDEISVVVISTEKLVSVCSCLTKCYCTRTGLTKLIIH